MVPPETPRAICEAAHRVQPDQFAHLVPGAADFEALHDFGA